MKKEGKEREKMKQERLEEERSEGLCKQFQLLRIGLSPKGNSS